MSIYIVANRVPTPEEMAEILGLSADRVDAVRGIMSAPVLKKKSSAKVDRVSSAQKEASRKQRNRRSLSKR